MKPKNQMSKRVILALLTLTLFISSITVSPTKAYADMVLDSTTQNDFTVEQKVHLANDEEWHDTINAKVGDKVEFQIKYTNTSDQQQDNVAIKDILPSNLRYVEGSTKIKNENHPNGDTLDHDYLVTDGQKVGNYGPGANVRLMFTAEVVDDNLACGKNTLVNWAQAGVGEITIQDEARVVVQNNKIFYVIAAIYIVTVAICLIIIIILARKVTKLKARNKGSAEV